MWRGFQSNYGRWGLTARGGGGAPYDPSFYGWSKTLDEGVTGDWFVDGGVALSGDGTTLATAFKTIGEAQSAMSGGDVVRIKDHGAPYREQFSFSGKGGSSDSARSKLVGYGTDKPFLSGAEVLTGIVPCVEADAPVVGPNWASMYKIEGFDATNIADSDPRAMNLYEAGEALDFAIDWLPDSNMFWTNDVRSYHTATNVYAGGDVTATSGDVVTGFKSTSVTDNYSAVQIENANILWHASGNTAQRSAIDSFSADDDIIRITTTAMYDDGTYKDRFALINLLPAMQRGGHGFVDNGDGTCDIYIWPRDPANITSKIEYSARSWSINIADESNIEIASLQVGQCAGVDKLVGMGIRDGGTTANENVTVRNAFIGEMLYVHIAQSGNGAVNFSRISNGKFWNSTIRHVRGTFGFYAGSGSVTSDENGTVTAAPFYDDLDVRFCDIQYVEQAPIRVFTAKTPIIAWNRLWNNGVGVHANKLNFYEQSHDILAWGNDFAGSDGYATWQEADNLFWAMNYIPVSEDATSSGGRAIQDQNNDTDNPSINLEDGVTNLLFNNHCPPYSGKLDATNAIQIGKDAHPNTLYSIFNSIFHGDNSDADEIDERDYNITTIGTAAGSNSVDSSVSEMYVDAANGNLSVKSDAPARTMIGKDMREIIATVLIPRFGDRFSDWSLDINRNPINWTDAPVGPANYRVSAADTTGPEISSISPTEGATDVAVDAALTITFDEPVVAGSGNISIYDASDDTLIEAFDAESDVTFDRLTASFTPTIPLTGSTDYYVLIDVGTMKDISGNEFAGVNDPETWSFTTVATSTAWSFQSTGAIASTGVGSTGTYISKENAFTAGDTVQKIGVFCTTPCSMVVGIAGRDSATQYDIVVAKSYSHGGTGWEDVTLSTPYVIPSGDVYYPYMYSSTSIDRLSTSNARAFIGSPTVNNNVTGWTENANSATPVMRANGIR